MKLSEQLKHLNPDTLTGLMHADCDAYEQNGEGPDFFVNYLNGQYPNLLSFVVQSTSEMPFADDQEKAISFMLGASFALAALCRAVETLELPPIE